MSSSGTTYSDSKLFPSNHIVLPITSGIDYAQVFLNLTLEIHSFMHQVSIYSKLHIIIISVVLSSVLYRYAYDILINHCLFWLSMSTVIAVLSSYIYMQLFAILGSLYDQLFTMTVCAGLQCKMYG